MGRSKKLKSESKEFQEMRDLALEQLQSGKSLTGEGGVLPLY